MTTSYQNNYLDLSVCVVLSLQTTLHKVKRMLNKELTALQEELNRPKREQILR